MATVLNTTFASLLGGATEETPFLVEMFGDVLARWMVANTDNGDHTYTQDRYIDLIQRFILLNYQRDRLAPADAANYAGCSVRAVHQACALHGTTFGGWLLRTRLNAAAHKLSHATASISTVAFDCGFTTVSHFCHAFKIRYGVTARAMRKSYR
jgi:AraC-like DNA-binding protein